MQYDAFARYMELLKKVDAFTASVLQEHGNHINCRRGCDECCRRSFSIFAVEALNLKAGFDLLSKQMRRLILNNMGYYNHAGSPCPLLHNSGCLLYEYRPVICRTHGLPVRSSHIRIKGERVTALCDRNFSSPGSVSGLDERHILNLDTLNAVLSSINLLYIKENGTPAGAPSQTGRLIMPEIFTG